MNTKAGACICFADAYNGLAKHRAWPQQKSKVMIPTINIGYWVVEGYGHNADWGFVFSKVTDDHYLVLWFGTMKTTRFAEGGTARVFAAKETAHAELMLRKDV